MKRRNFLKCVGCTAAASAAMNTDLLQGLVGGIENVCAFDFTTRLSGHEALHYERREGGGIECRLCPRHCYVTDLERGYCGVRENQGDVYRSLVYGLPCAANIDPIEKKPLFHFYPGTTAFSLATAGCNVNCKFCQNWEISQTRPEQSRNFELLPADAVNTARANQAPTVAFTYSEPVVFYEYMYDTARIGRKSGLRSVMITGGYIEPKPLAELIPVLDGIKVDLKSIRSDYYRDVVGGDLQPVLDGLVQMRHSGIWLEIVYLVVPTLNDSDRDFRDLSIWIRQNLGADVPVHFSRFHPQYLLRHLPSTPRATLERAHAIARAEGLQFVYLGNIPGHEAENSFCPKCGKVVIGRRGYRITVSNLKENRCRFCDTVIPGRF